MHGLQTMRRLFCMQPILMAGLLALAFGLSSGHAQAQKSPSRKPLAMEGHAEFYQRVLTLPGAELRVEPNDTARPQGDRLPTFSILYVFARRMMDGVPWLEVTSSIDGERTAWLRASAAQDWSVMLVMQYAPPGQRLRVPFFSEAAQLSKLVQDPQVAKQARALVETVDSGTHDRKTVIAIEPMDRLGTPTFKSRPYVMPILASQSDESSMGPYIDRVRKVVRELYARLERENKLSHTSFGVVAYRNNMDGRPQLEYVAKVFQPLKPGSPPTEVLASLDRLKPATVSTHSWDEDGLFGLHTALNSPEIEWSKFDARILIQVSDSGMLDGGDPKVQLKNISIANIREMADRRGVAIVPIHLLTPESEKEGDIPKARAQYIELGKTGDPAANKYLPIPAGDPERFEQIIRTATDRLATAINSLVENRSLVRPALTQQSPLADVLVNELFRVQQTYVGEKSGTDAPPFVRAWASDKDLANPKNEALKVAVFLTRNQLNNLAQSLRAILDSAKRAQLAPQTLFDQLRSLSASTAVAPNQRKAESIADTGLLPSYLKLLPYQSQLLKLTSQAWLDQGFSGQQSLLAALEFKLQAYSDINASDVWIDLGSKDRGVMVYPLPMELLP